jgi:cytochrome c-type biogenesis protein CcmH
MMRNCCGTLGRDGGPAGGYRTGMLVWIFLALMTGFAVLAVLLPLARRGEGRAVDMRATDRAFYEAQIAEIDRDRDRGLLEPFEATTARVEAARRLLAADRRERGIVAPAAGSGRTRLAAAMALLGIPLVSLGLYLTLGHPELPAQPLAARSDGVNQAGGMDEAIAKIEKHLAEHPDDGRGFEVVAPVYLSMGRYDDAVRAYQNAIRLLGEQPIRLENYAEALVATADGTVTAEARKVVDRALALEPRLIKARFFRALAAEQDGDVPAAVGRYQELSAEAPAGSPLASLVGERLAKLGAEVKGPASPAGASIAAMPKGDQLAMIRGMVENLAAKLATDGSDAQGWQRLVRSYVVLGEKDKARDAYQRGLSALAGDPSGRAGLEALGRELAIGGS